MLVGIAYDAADIVGAFQRTETGAVDDVTVFGIAYDAAHTSHTRQAVAVIKDEIGNDGMRHQCSLGHTYKAQTVDALVGIDNAANTVAIAVERALERMVGSA